MSRIRRLATSSLPKQVGQLKRLTAAAPDEAIDYMRKDGAVIIEQLATRASVSQSLRDVDESLRKGYLKYKTDDFFEDRTSRATGLIGKSRTYVHDQLNSTILHQISRFFLTTTHMQEAPEYSWTTPPQISSTVAFQIDPGAKSQVLHRDDTIYNYKHVPINSWDELRDHHREATLSMFVAATKTTKENGATRLVLGSHLWGDDVVPKEEDVVHAELEPGDALFMLSSVYHAGSENRTQNEKRVVFASAVARGVLRQEENQFLVTPPEVIRGYPEEVQKFAGFRQDFPELGWTKIKERR